MGYPPVFPPIHSRGRKPAVSLDEQRKPPHSEAAFFIRSFFFFALGVSVGSGCLSSFADANDRSHSRCRVFKSLYISGYFSAKSFFSAMSLSTLYSANFVLSASAAAFPNFPWWF